MRAAAAFVAPDVQPAKRRATWSTYFLDVSNNNGPHLDFRQVARDSRHTGITAVEMKATQSTAFRDPYFEEWRDTCERAGLRTFAYHFARPDEGHGAEAEAHHFCDTVQKIRPGEWRPMLDFETAPFDAEWVKDWNFVVRKRLGVAPMLYSFWSALVSMGLTKPLSDDLILAYPNGLPRAAPCPHPWKHWQAHQYSWHGRVRGIPGEVDLNWTPNVWNLLAYPARGAALEPLYAARRRKA